MNKKIIFIILAVVIIAIAGCLIYVTANKTPQGNNNIPANSVADPEKSCKDSGGVVISAMCCNSAGDFPNRCLVGACGCSPSNSHEVKICECYPDKCFDGYRCVPNL